MGDIVGGDLALLNGNMDNLMQASAIANSIDVWQISLHPMVGGDSSVFDLHSNAIERQRSDVWMASERKENFFGLNANGFALVSKGHILMRAQPPGIQELGAGINGDSFSAKHCFQFGRRVRVEFVQQMRAALDQGYADAESGKELREFNGDSAATEHNQGLGQAFELKGRVTVQAIQGI